MRHLRTTSCGLIGATVILAGLFSDPAAVMGQDMPLSQVLLEDEPWRVVAEDLHTADGAAVDSTGQLYVADSASGRIIRLTASGRLEDVATDDGQPAGLMFGPGQKLFYCRQKTGQVVARGADNSEEVIATLPDCRDLVVARNGRIYVTDAQSPAVWLLEPSAPGEVVKPVRVADGFRPEGIVLWRDEGTLVVTDADRPVLKTYRIEADGRLKFGADYYSPLQLPFFSPETAQPAKNNVAISQPGHTRVSPQSDGMTIDQDGRLYVCTAVGIQMFDPTGRLGGTISKPQSGPLFSVVFGGPDLKTMYATAGDKVFARRVRPAGVPSLVRSAVLP